MRFLRGKITEQTPQYSVCLSLEYEKLQDWLNKTVYNVNYGTPNSSNSEIMSSVQSGSEDSAASGFTLENCDPIGSAPLSAHKILPDNGGDDPAVPSDVALDEIVSVVDETVRAQKQYQSDSEGATLEREARIELQKQTGEAFPDEDDGVGSTLDDQDASADAAMDVDDSATSVAPTEAVNPAYAMDPPPTKLPRTGTASGARKFFTGSALFCDTSDLAGSTTGEPHPPPPKPRPASTTPSNESYRSA